MKILLYIALIVLLVSCENQSNEKISNFQNDSTIINGEENRPKRDTIQIDYETHKDLLEIIKILPDTLFDTWFWKKQERTQFVDFIKQNNYTINTIKHVGVRKINTHYFGMDVIDSYWELSMYKIKPQHYIVICDMSATGIASYDTYEYNNGGLKNVNITDLFGDNVYTVLTKDKTDTMCMQQIKKYCFWVYHLKDSNIVTATLESLGDEDEYESCINSNSLTYKFNPLSKKFDLIGVEKL